jgi:hypothetical protein
MAFEHSVFHDRTSTTANFSKLECMRIGRDFLTFDQQANAFVFVRDSGQDRIRNGDSASFGYIKEKKQIVWRMNASDNSMIHYMVIDRRGDVEKIIPDVRSNNAIQFERTYDTARYGTCRWKTSNDLYLCKKGDNLVLDVWKQNSTQLWSLSKFSETKQTGESHEEQNSITILSPFDQNSLVPLDPKKFQNSSDDDIVGELMSRMSSIRVTRKRKVESSHTTMEASSLQNADRENNETQKRPRVDRTPPLFASNPSQYDDDLHNEDANTVKIENSHGNRIGSKRKAESTAIVNKRTRI